MVTDINDEKSKKTGVAGVLETIIIRKFKTLSFLITLAPIALMYLFCLAVAFFPAVVLLKYAWSETIGMGFLAQAVALALAAAGGFLGFIFGLMGVVPLVNWPIKPFVKPFRGAWYSFDTVAWFYHNALTYLVRYTVLDLLTPSPVSLWFYKAMGMKIGKNVMINTSNISDPCLIEIDDYSVLGGSCYLMAHYGQKGFLVIDRLKIGRNVNVGLHAYLMGGVEVGDYAVIYPNAMVLPKTKIEERTRFGHVDGVLVETKT